MQNLVQKYVERFLHERTIRHRLARVMLFLALAVGIGVYWQLHLSGAALTNEVYCGKEEHTHNDECYENILICDLEEVEEHTHDETCYESVQTLICGLEEGEEHTHSEACYQAEEVLTCQLEEGAGHLHTEECYEERLACTLEEHTHTIECMIDETADVENASDWLATIPALSGDDRTDLVAVAKSQVGYTESTRNFALDADGVTHRGYTRYGAWYGNKYGVWDAMFVSFCLTNAGISVSDFPQSSGAYAWAIALSDAGLYREASEYTPEAGDLIFFDEDGDSRIDHVGIVSYVTDNSLQVIEGDSNDRVEMNTCARAGSRVVGYGRLSGDDQEAEAEAEDGPDSVTEDGAGCESGFATETEAESESGSVAEAESESGSVTEIRGESESDFGAEEEVRSETGAESEKDARSETELVTALEEKAETDAESLKIAEGEMVSGAVMESGEADGNATETEAEAETGTVTVSEADTKAENDSEAESDTEENLESALDSATELEGALLEQTLTVEVDDKIVTLSGLLPDHAQVSVIPVDVAIENRQVLLALDITIFYEDGEVFEPENGTVTVVIEAAEITEEALVYYVPVEGEPQELPNDAQEGSVVFDAEHFSTYAVTASEISESDTVIASGTMANAAGTEDAITWALTEDDLGARTLTVRGEGAIPDYSSQDDGQPWYSYRSTETKLVFGEGITRVGTNAFRGWTISEIAFSSTIESLGAHAFSYSASTLKAVTIPGNIKTIERDAFAYGWGLVDITLEDGVESIGSNAFGSYATAGTVIQIPASVKSIGSGTPLETNCFWGASAFEVSEENEYYCSVDGVLYSKDMTVLVDYPNLKVADSYTIPASVETVAYGAFVRVTNTSELYITENQNITLYGYMLRYSSFSYVYVMDGVQLPTIFVFSDMSELESVRLPEDTALTIGASYFSLDTALTSLIIPNGTISIGAEALTGTTNLESLYYNAENAQIDSLLFGTNSQPMFDLTIGAEVNYLEANFSYVIAHTNSVTIEGENTFYVEEGAFENAPVSYTELSGWVYVSDEGVIYSLDPDTRETMLYYCPDDVVSLTIPAEITAVIDGAEVKFAVTAVASNALKEADVLTEVTFENASAITALEAYALANAPISRIIDAATGTIAETVTDAEVLFTNDDLYMGYNVFYNTNLGEAEKESDYSTTMDGVQSVSTGDGTGLTVTVTSGTTTEWEYSDEAQTVGGYTSLTGDTVTFVVYVSNTTGDTVTYRLYMRTTGDDCVVPTLGEHTVNDVTYMVCATEDPYTIYLEFSADTGSTKNFNVTAVYPSPSSAGGGVTVWGVSMEQSQDSTLSEGETTDTICAYWKTSPDTYTLSKTNRSSQNSISITADDDGIVRPSTELKYTISLTSDGETSTFGKDYVTVVTYIDALTLPDGMTWDPDVLAAIRGEEGAASLTRRSNVLYAGDTKIVALELSSSSGLSLSSLAVSYDEETEQVILSWKVKNSSDYNLNTNTLYLTIYPEAFLVDSSVYSINAENVITNEATASVHYTYSGTKESAASVDKSVTGGSGTVKILKTKETDVTYFGEDLTYRIKVYNDGGLTFSDPAGAYTITDTLSDTLYISAANMETMFREAAVDGTALTITITGAELGSGAIVSDTSGSGTARVNTGNTDLDDVSTGLSLTITCAASDDSGTVDGSDASGNSGTEVTSDTTNNTGTSGDEETEYSDTCLYTVSVSDGQSISGADLASLLQSLGYGVTRSSIYQCDWVLPVDADGCFVLTSGQSYAYLIYTTVKSTFQILDGSDWPGTYQGPDFSISNRATLNPPNGSTQGKISSSALSDTVKREAVINKSVSKDGKNLGSAPEASDGDVLDYTLTFTHYGTGVYEDLPMVDDLYGSQYLLAEVSENPALSGYGLSVYTDEKTGIEYYILTEGSYSNVIIGSMTAASITVTSGVGETFSVNDESYSWSGVHTQIKWYFAELDGETYTIRISYKVLVDTTGYETDYTIGNMVWMNDRTGSRLYAGLWGGGTIIGFAKEIVTDDPEADEDGDGIDDDGFSEIAEGTQVTYRLTLSNKGDSGSFTLNGKNLADLLPETFGIFAWNEENVSLDRIEVDEDSSGSVEGLNSLEEWYIGTEYNGIKGDGLYFILWGNETSVIFSGNVKVYLYITLTFPLDTEADEENGTMWSDYAEAAKGATLSNTLYVYRNPANVTHVLSEEGKVVLQKGVYALLRCSQDAQISTSNYGTYYATGSTRDYYNNEDSNYRYVLYYLTLYNDGGTRLYINDIYDDLPEGFTYVSLVSDASFVKNETTFFHTNAITTMSEGASGTWLTTQDDEVTYMSAFVSATASDGQIKFTVGAGSGSSYALSYDEEMGQYYLEKGQAVVFGYLCQIGTAQETESNAVNTAAMPYTDYTGAGVSVGDAAMKAGELSRYNSRNDGDCAVYTEGEVSALYGFSDAAGNSSWLVSEVTMTKGGIKPGVIKETVSYQVSENAEPITYTNSVTYKDLVNWQVTLQNGGDMSIVDYVVTDTMPYPYVFTGAVIFTMFDSDNRQISAGTLFTFPNLANTESLSEGDTVTVYKGISTTNTVEITVGGAAVDMNSVVAQNGEAYAYSLRLDIDESGNLIMEIGMEDTRLAIPEGGYVVINYASWNPTNVTSNQTLLNQISLVTSQVIDKSAIQSGSAVYDAAGNVVGASSLSPLTVTAGYSTNSYKTVTATGTDTAYSNSMENTILLSDAASTFTYTLNVQNINNEAITKMVLIDNLPSEDDFYTYNTDIERGSAFGVMLADTVFRVTISAESGEETTLDAQDYTVEWSSFAPSEDSGFSAEDRAGSPDDKWKELTEQTDLSEVRSIRVTVNTDIPANALLTVSFTAKISDGESPAPGSSAWNNFGYGYWVGNSATELEAMPLAVGVKVPSAPGLVKKLVDESGEATTAAGDSVFNFLIYRTEAVWQSDTLGTGEAGTNPVTVSGTEIVWTYSDGMLLANGEEITLDEGDYQIVSLTVKEGNSASDILILTEDVVGWAWESGTEYTIVELFQGTSNGSYALKEWDAYGSRVSTEDSYTFAYDPETELTITCVNLSQRWAINLTKVDKASKEDDGTYATMLEGAVFALYSQTESGLYAKYAEEIGQGAEACFYTEKDSDADNEEGEDTGADAGTDHEADGATATDIDASDGSVSVPWTIDADGVSWYLYAVGTTSEAGILTFADLTEAQYNLVEIKAPDGYNLDEAPVRVERSDASDGSCVLTIENQAGAHLPLTGGVGAQKTMGLGLTLMAGAAMLQIVRRQNKRKHSGC